MKTAMAFGVFDGLHKGHGYFLKRCASFGRLTVVVARDSTVMKVKKKMPYNNERSRLATVSRLSYVEKTVLGDRKDMFTAIKKSKPDTICLGYDQKAFTRDIEKKLKSFGIRSKVVRIKAYKPETYKSSLIMRDIYP